MAGRQTAIVTGGRRGIGGAICKALAKKGFNIVCVDVERDAAAEETMAAVGRAGAAAEFLEADVSELPAHAKILDAAGRLPGQPSCLVNNAGVTSLVRGDMLELTPESYDRVMRINLRGAFFLSQAFAKLLIARQARTPEGEFRSIINVTSANAEILALERADYALSKVAMSAMTRHFAARLARHLINVYEIRPGMIKTDMTAPMAARYDKVVADGGVPFGRWGLPEDVAQAAAVLATGGLAFTTGDFVWVDGGIGLRMG